MAGTSNYERYPVEDERRHHRFPKDGDWRSRGFLTVPSEESCSKLRLPFEIWPEDRDYIKKEFTQNLRHLVAMQEGAPWTGYYAVYKGAKLAVSNSFGVWFEIRKRESRWEAFRVARTSLDLKSWMLPGINATELIKSGEPTNEEVVEEIKATRAASRASQRDPPPHQDPPEQPEREAPGDPGRYQPGGLGNWVSRKKHDDDDGDDPYSSNTARRGRGGPPHNPYQDPDPYDTGNARNNGERGGTRLEGDPPEFFEGDRGKTMEFLTAFKRFMIMNRDSAIAKDPYKKCAYFMGRIRGAKTRGWVQRNYDWLDLAEEDPTELMGRSPWTILEEDFRRSFVDYAQQEKAHDDLQKLKMTQGNIDEYISEFQMLGHQAHMDLDDPAALRLFARGLPNGLADSCIDLDSPESFEQWRNSAQRQHRAWLKKQALHRNYDRPPQPRPPPPKWNGLWRPRNPGTGAAPPRPRLPPRDPYAMDTSAGKATTEEQKKKHREEGRCYECSKQGHLARNCPDRKPRVRSAEVSEEVEETSKKGAPPTPAWRMQDMIARAMKFTDEEREAFIQGLQEEEEETEDPGFLEA